MAEFRSHRGRIRPVLVLSVSLLALCSVALSGIAVVGKILLTLAVSLAAWFSLARAPKHAIRLDRTSSPSLDGVRGRLSGEAVTSLFVALKLVAADGEIRRAFLFCDELDGDAFRALLAYLRHG